VIIREVRPGEQARVGELRVTAYRSIGLLPEGSVYADTLRGFGFGFEGDCTVLVAVDAAGEIVGTVAFEPFSPGSELARDDAEADVRAFAVSARSQGQGVGRRLLTAVVEYAADRGIRTLRLCTQPAMTTAQRLYAAAGFVRTPDFDFEPVPGLTLRAYELTLAPGTANGAGA
jgi:ribosomal protein S18 acetylase RimI-like enzyme